MICNRSQVSSTSLGVTKETVKRDESLLVINPSASNLCNACLIGVREIPRVSANLFSLIGEFGGILNVVMAFTK